MRKLNEGLESRGKNTISLTPWKETNTVQKALCYIQRIDLSELLMLQQSSETVQYNITQRKTHKREKWWMSDILMKRM